MTEEEFIMLPSCGQREIRRLRALIDVLRNTTAALNYCLRELPIDDPLRQKCARTLVAADEALKPYEVWP